MHFAYTINDEMSIAGKSANPNEVIGLVSISNEARQLSIRLQRLDQVIKIHGLIEDRAKLGSVDILRENGT